MLQRHIPPLQKQQCERNLQTTGNKKYFSFLINSCLTDYWAYYWFDGIGRKNVCLFLKIRINSYFYDKTLQQEVLT